MNRSGQVRYGGIRNLSKMLQSSVTVQIESTQTISLASQSPQHRKSNPRFFEDIELKTGSKFHDSVRISYYEGMEEKREGRMYGIGMECRDGGRQELRQTFSLITLNAPLLVEKLFHPVIPN